MSDRKILIHEVGLRDGLQAEQTTVPSEIKLRWLDMSMDSGVDIIQVGSFVHLEKMPQMADTDLLFHRLKQPGMHKPQTVLSGLVLNEKGLDRSLACDMDLICMGVSASETHSRKNTGMSVAEATQRILGMGRKVLQLGKPLQASVQSAFGCGFEGMIPRERVLEIVKSYLDAGICQISLADTAGYAHPFQVEDMFGEIQRLDPGLELACHFHNTYGLGLANCMAALRAGVRLFESSFGGLGGCPFTKVPAGNVCTEDLVHSFQRMGMRKDIHLDRLVSLAGEVSAYFQRELPGLVLRAGTIEGTKNQGKQD